MITFSEKSWHRWLHNQTSYRLPDNLCPYFWQCMAGLLKVICIALAGALMGVFVVTWMATPLLYITDGLFGLYHPFVFKNQSTFLLFMSIGTCLWLIVFALTFAFFWEKSEPWRDARRERLGLPSRYGPKPAKKPKPPGLLKSFFRAHHDKICPRIEFVE